jgi:transcriptional regulator with PAS, ATPase and Fis domain
MERLNSQQRELEERYGYHSIVGVSAHLRKIYALIDRIKDIQTTVLVTGESGTGKECVARAIHFSGSRAGRPFVSLNCGAIPATLVESELFGYERGAFTGADRPHSGLFKQADGGTLFLDEIGLMGMDIQAKLLRVLQEGQIRPLGSTATVPVNARIIAPTSASRRPSAKGGSARTFTTGSTSCRLKCPLCETASRTSHCSSSTSLPSSTAPTTATWRRP